MRSSPFRFLMVGLAMLPLACGQPTPSAFVDGGGTLPSDETPRSTAAEAPASLPEPAEVIDHRVQDAETPRQFWSRQAMPAALELEHFGTLQGMARSADLVVLAVIDDVVQGPTIGAEQPEGEGAIPLSAYQLEVIRVISGELPQGPLLLNLPAMARPSVGPETAGPVLLFLRSGAAELNDGAVVPPELEGWFASTHRLVSLQGAYYESEHGLENPLSEIQYEGSDPVAREWTGRNLSEMIAVVESLGS